MFDIEKRDATYFLTGLEQGTLSAADAAAAASKLDPVTVYFAIRYLRSKYPATDPRSQGVVERLLELTSTYDEVVAMSRKGEKDPIREWFDDTHDIREFFDDPEGFMGLIVEKVEG